jgi:membrane protease YdiL (CAAX protease family)
MKRTFQFTLVTFLAFGLYFFLDALYFKDVRGWLFGVIGQWGLSHNLAYLLFGIPIFAGALVLHKKEKLGQSLGLDKSVPVGMLFALACTLPMFLGFASFFEFQKDVNLNTLLVSIVAAGFFEELYFRGFLFGQLFRYTRLGFVGSVLAGAVLFGLVHLYQGSSLEETTGVFLITFAGGILFAWVFAEWHYNLWVPVFLHMLMNLAWELFSVSDTALGGWVANLCRLGTIMLVIGLTLVRKRRRQQPLVVNRHTWFLWRREDKIQAADGRLQGK